MFDYIRVAAAVPTVKVGDTKANVREIRWRLAARLSLSRSLRLPDIPAQIYSFRKHCIKASLKR